MYHKNDGVVTYTRGADVTNKSDWVHTVAYDDNTHTMYVTTQDYPDVVYVYTQVPTEKFDLVLQAAHSPHNTASVGRIYTENIKGYYTGYRLDDVELVWEHDFEADSDKDVITVSNSTLSNPTLVLNVAPAEVVNVPVNTEHRVKPNRVAIAGYIRFSSGHERIRSEFTDMSDTDAHAAVVAAAQILGLDFTVTEVTGYFD